MNKLWVRLSLAFTAVVLVAVIIVVATRFFIEQLDGDGADYMARSLDRPGGLVQQLADYYADHQSWAEVEPMLVGAQAVYRRSDTAFLLLDAERRVIAYPGQQPGANPARQMDSLSVVPIRVQAETVGYLGLAPLRSNLHDDDGGPPFINVLGDVLLGLALVGGVGGTIFGVVVSRSLTAPLNNLAEAARAIGARNLSRRVAEAGSDEVIAVARAFNDMAADLEHGEQLRRNLLADVAHELRTPLAVLQGNLRAILDEVYPLNLDEMARLYEHTRFLSRLVNDLHELAQAEARQLPLTLHSTDLASLVQTTADTFRPGSEAKGVSLSLNLVHDLPPLKLDAGRIRQVLQNLLANALRHTPPQGSISLNLEPGPTSVLLTVADTGEGIPADHLPHIFDRFYRTDPARSRDQGGAGLGLAIARAIIEAHGGQIRVASEGMPGRGSTFTIQLPLTAPQSVSA
mgnify:CR=1 FL=1